MDLPGILPSLHFTPRPEEGWKWTRTFDVINTTVCNDHRDVLTSRLPAELSALRLPMTNDISTWKRDNFERNNSTDSWTNEDHILFQCQVGFVNETYFAGQRLMKKGQLFTNTYHTFNISYEYPVLWPWSNSTRTLVVRQSALFPIRELSWHYFERSFGGR